MKTAFQLLFALALGAIVPAALATDQPFDAARYKGKVVYIDFWASWCVPCRKSFPWLNDLARKHPDDLVVVGINVDNEREAADKFLARYPAAFPLVFDPQGTVATRYALEGMPSAILLDREGRIVHRHVGFREEKRGEYEAMVEQLIRGG